MTTPKFMQGKGDFHIELKNRVNQYFTDRKNAYDRQFFPTYLRQRCSSLGFICNVCSPCFFYTRWFG